MLPNISDRWLPLLAMSLAGVVLLWTVYDIAKGFFVSDVALSNDRAEQKNAAVSIPEYRIADIINAHLFGEAQRQAPTQVHAPRTRLRLHLMGMVASDDPKRAIALIAHDHGPSKPYRVGDAIKPSGAVLRAVEADKVIIERSGRLESLYIERPTIDEPNKGVRAAPTPSRGAARPTEPGVERPRNRNTAAAKAAKAPAGAKPAPAATTPPAHTPATSPPRQ